jgi:predicted esterase
MKLFLYGCILIVCLYCSVATAQNATIQTVKCDADTTQSYSIAFPANYNPDKKYPILFLFDPGARGRAAVGFYKDITQAYGFILIGSNNSRNGPMGTSLNAANAMFTDAFKKYRLDESQIYLSGFSGGARVATTIALQSAGITGVIACSAGFGEEIPKGKLSFTFAATTGTRDFNYIEMLQTTQILQPGSTPAYLQVFNGTHSWPPTNVFRNALLWSYLQHQKPGEVNAALQKEGQAIPDGYNVKAMAGQIIKEYAFQQIITEAFQFIFFRQGDNIKSKSWWRGQLVSLNKMLLSHNIVDSDYVFRQKAFINGNIGENFGNYYTAKRYDTATELLIVAEILEPDNPQVFYRHALLSAAESDQYQTIYYLQQAAKHGSRNQQQWRHEPAFEFLKDDKRFLALLN